MTVGNVVILSINCFMVYFKGILVKNKKINMAFLSLKL